MARLHTLSGETLPLLPPPRGGWRALSSQQQSLIPKKMTEVQRVEEYFYMFIYFVLGLGLGWGFESASALSWLRICNGFVFWPNTQAVCDRMRVLHNFNLTGFTDTNDCPEYALLLQHQHPRHHKGPATTTPVIHRASFYSPTPAARFYHS